MFVPKRVGDFSDLSFLLNENVEEFIRSVDELELTDEEIENKKLELEDDIERKLKTLNQKMHDELSIEVGSRVKLIAGLVMAGLGVPGKVAPLKVEDLNGEISDEDNDGAKVMRKISSYLKEKHLPKEKIEMIKSVLSVVFVHSKLAEPVN